MECLESPLITSKAKPQPEFLKLLTKYSDNEARREHEKKGSTMYTYMVFDVSNRVLYKDFLSYHKRCDEDDFYIVSLDNPHLIQYLEEFLERRLN